MLTLFKRETTFAAKLDTTTTFEEHRRFAYKEETEKAVNISALAQLMCASTLDKLAPFTRPAKSGGSWDPRSKKIFGLQENFQPKSRTFVENLVFVTNNLK